MIKAVVFDVFQTLVRRTAGSPHHLHELANYLGVGEQELASACYSVEGEFCSGGIHEEDRYHRVLDAVGLPLNPSAVGRMIFLEAQGYRQSHFFYEGVPELLESLRAHFKVGVCSNANPVQTAYLHAIGLMQRVDATAFSCYVGCLKPNPLIYESIQRKLDVKPWETLFVGDGTDDELYGAARAGMQTCKVLHLEGFAGQNPCLRAAKQIERVSQLHDLLGNFRRCYP